MRVRRLKLFGVFALCLISWRQPLQIAWASSQSRPTSHRIFLGDAVNGLPARGRRDAIVGLLAAGVPLAADATERIDSPGDAEAISTLKRWVKDNGGSGMENIDIRFFNKGGQQVRGVAATRDLAPKDTLFSIPKDIILSAQHPTVLNSPFGDEADPFQRVQLFLAFERRKLLSGIASFWTPYIRTLPTIEDYSLFHPLFSEMQVLNAYGKLAAAQNVQALIGDQQSRWVDNQEKWIAAARKGGVSDFAFDDYYWALATVLSRGYKAEYANPALVPISDLANSGSEPSVSWRGGQLTGNPPSWGVDTIRPLRKGDEVLEIYQSDQPNDVYFKLYGFTFPENPARVAKADSNTCGTLPKKIQKKSSSIEKSFQAIAREACSFSIL